MRLLFVLFFNTLVVTGYSKELVKASSSESLCYYSNVSKFSSNIDKLTFKIPKILTNRSDLEIKASFRNKPISSIKFRCEKEGVGFVCNGEDDAGSFSMKAEGPNRTIESNALDFAHPDEVKDLKLKADPEQKQKMQFTALKASCK